MKKKILFILLVGVFLLSGCGKTSESSIIKDLEKKINNSKSYYIEGTLEIVNNEDLYTYDVKVSYAKGDNYKVNLTNKVNNHEQVILRNSDGVYVVTPRINKSFKFQSDWPENSPKPYIYHYLIQLLENNKVKKIEKGYQVEAKVKYPNDTRIVKQEVIFDKKLKPLIVLCLDQDEAEIVTCKVNEFHKNKNFKEKHFNQNQALKESKKDVKTSANNDVLYPVSLLGAKLESETVSSIEGDKNHILKFSGDKSFTMVETQVNAQQVMQFSNDEVIDLIDGFAYYQPGKLSMMYHGMMCSLYSQDLTKEEMLSVMTSMQTSSTK